MLLFDQLKKNDPPLRILSIAVLAGLFILLVGLWWVQIISNQRFSESERNQSYRTVRIPAARGKILDRNGEVLAENRPSYDIGLYFEELSPLLQDEWDAVKAKAREDLGRNPRGEEYTELIWTARFNVVTRIADQLAALMGVPVEVEKKAFKKHFDQLRALPMPLISNLETNLLARFFEAPELPPGIGLDVQPLRNYPHGTTAAHVLGHLQKDISSKPGEPASYNYRMPDYRGLIGLEATFDEELRGKAGMKSVLVNNIGYYQSENIWDSAEPGNNLVLTIDLPLQRVAEDAMNAITEDVRGAVVVMDALNGDLYALVSAPAYDPNSFVPFISGEEWQRLNDHESKQKPMMNRASQGMYHPGSVMKIVTALAAMKSGVLNENTLTNEFYNPGYYSFGNRQRPIKDLARPGYYDFRRAFIKSSNTYFIHYGFEAGFDAFRELGEAFQFGRSMELPTRQNTAGNFPTQRWLQRQRERGIPWSAGDSANLFIGQGYVDTTPLQVAAMIGAVANGGKVLQPRLVKRIEAQQAGYGEDSVIREFPPEVRGEVQLPAEYFQWTRAAMRADVEDPEGSGHNADVPGMGVSGKTGTAEVKQGGRQVDKIVWFASFAPYESPRYVVVVMVESGEFGGTTAAPVARKIYEEIQRRGGLVSTPRNVARR